MTALGMANADAAPRPRLTALLLCAVAASASVGCGDDEQPRPLYLGQLVVWPRDDGRVNRTELDGPTLLRGGWAEALVELGGQQLTVSTGGNCPGTWTVVPEPPTEADYFAGLRGWRRHTRRGPHRDPRAVPWVGGGGGRTLHALPLVLIICNALLCSSALGTPAARFTRRASG